MASDLITPILVSDGDTQSQVESNESWKPETWRGALARNPSVTDLQTPLNFRFFIRRLPDVTYHIAKTNVPGLTVPMAPFATNDVIIPIPGDHIQFEPLVVTFRVQEGMGNYFQLADWMKAVSAFDPEELKELAANPEWTGYGVTSDLLIVILNAQKNAIRRIFYHDAWPTQLSTLNFDSTLTKVNYVPATVVFHYRYYTTDTDV